MGPAQLRQKLLAENPDWCSTADVARMLGCDKRNVRHYDNRIPHKTVEGMKLYHRGSAIRCASVYTRNPTRLSHVGVSGVDVERLMRICEHYYRCQYDAAPPELLALAKRIARL